MIIHITGPPGSGKTTLGKFFADRSKKIQHLELDDLYMEFIAKREKKFKTIEEFKKHFWEDFRAYITAIITSIKCKNIIITGLNFPDPHIKFHDKWINLPGEYIKIECNYRYYLDVPLQTAAEHREGITVAAAKKIVKQDSAFWKKMYKKVDDNYVHISNKYIKSLISRLLFSI